MKNLHIENSYNIWIIDDMIDKIQTICWEQYGDSNAEQVLNRSYNGMYIEWWLHNIGYYITKPFCFIKFFKKINLRCRDVDLEEWLYFK